jgi:hypothetical protein
MLLMIALTFVVVVLEALHHRNERRSYEAQISFLQRKLAEARKGRNVL